MFKLLLVVLSLLLCFGASSCFEECNTSPASLGGSARERFRPIVHDILTKLGFANTYGYSFLFMWMYLLQPLRCSDYAAIVRHFKSNWAEAYEEMKGVQAEFAAFGFSITEELLVATLYVIEAGHVDYAVDANGFLLSPQCMDVVAGLTEQGAIVNHTHALRKFHKNDKELRRRRKLGCTSMIIQHKDNSIIHARNLEFQPIEINLMTTTVKYYENNHDHDASYIATGFPWGELTCMNEKITHANHFRASDTPFSADDLVARLNANYHAPQMIMMRTFMRQKTSFEDTVTWFMNNKLVTGMYNMLTGRKRGEGAVVIHRGDSATVKRLNSTQSDGWFLVQTNYDCLEPECGCALNGDCERGTAAVQRIKGANRDKINEVYAGMAVVLPPVAHNYTLVHTNIMNVKVSYHLCINRPVVAV